MSVRVDDSEDVPRQLINPVNEYAILDAFYADHVGVEVVDDLLAQPGVGIEYLYLFADSYKNIAFLRIDDRNLLCKGGNVMLSVGQTTVDCFLLRNDIIPCHCLDDGAVLLVQLLGQDDFMDVSEIGNRLDRSLTRC